jgi:hypothetical protein
VGSDDLLHDHELEDSADDGTERLHPERRTRRKFRILRHLEITSKGESLRSRLVAVEGEVHVGLRVSGDEGGTEHLGELLDVGFEAGDGVDDADEGEPGSGREETASEGVEGGRGS